MKKSREWGVVVLLVFALASVFCAGILLLRLYAEKAETEQAAAEKGKAAAEKSVEDRQEKTEETQENVHRYLEEQVLLIEGEGGYFTRMQNSCKSLSYGPDIEVWDLGQEGVCHSIPLERPEGDFRVCAALDQEGDAWILHLLEQSGYEVWEHDSVTGEIKKKIPILAEELPLEAGYSYIHIHVSSSYIYILYKSSENGEDYYLRVFDQQGRLVDVQENIFDIALAGEDSILTIGNTIQYQNVLKRLTYKNGALEKEQSQILKTVEGARLIDYAGAGNIAYLMTNEDIFQVTLDEALTAEDVKKAEPGESEKKKEQAVSIFSFTGDSAEGLPGYLAGDFFVREDGSIDILYYLFEVRGLQREIWRYRPIEGQADQAEEISLTLTMPYPIPVIRAAAGLYEKQYPGRRVQIETAYESMEAYMDYGTSYTDSLPARIMTGDYGDILLSSHGVFSWDLLAGDSFVDLSDWIVTAKSYEEVDQNLIDGAKVKGKLQGIPVALSHNYYIVNQKLWEQTDRNKDGHVTWMELLTQAEHWTKEGSPHYVFAFESGDRLMDLLEDNLPCLIDLEEKRIDLEQEWFLELMKKYKQVYRQEALDLTEEMAESDQTPWTFAMERGAMLFAENHMNKEEYLYGLATDAMGYYKDQETYDILLTVKKGIAGEVKESYSTFPFLFFSLNPAAKEKEAALDFLELLLSEEVQERLPYNYIPVNKKARENRLELAKSNGTPVPAEEIERFYQGLEQTILQSEYLYPYGFYLNDLYEPMQDYVIGRTDLDAAIKEAGERLWIRMNE